MRDLVKDRLAGTEPAPKGTPPRVPVPGDLPEPLRRLTARMLTPAAVLVPLVLRSNGLKLLLTQRTEHLKHHAGQISFPGGRIEAEDDGPVGAALRETEEEIGLDPGFVEVIGFLDDYVTITGYSVTPVVAFVREGFDLALDAFEVAEAFEVPFDFVMNPANHRQRPRRMAGINVGYYEIEYEDRRIWGATAGMLVHLYERLHG